jgi:hypothetical protein
VLQTSDFTISSPFGNGGGKVGDFSGWVFGGGVESKLTGPLAMKLEYRFSDFDTKNVPISLGPIGLNGSLDTTEHVIKLGLVSVRQYRGQPESALRMRLCGLAENLSGSASSVGCCGSGVFGPECGERRVCLRNDLRPRCTSVGLIGASGSL